MDVNGDRIDEYLDRLDRTAVELEITLATCHHCGELVSVDQLRDVFGSVFCTDAEACDERYDSRVAATLEQRRRWVAYLVGARDVDQF